jgi:lipoprotein-releasing system ATP-binding protein
MHITVKNLSKTYRNSLGQVDREVLNGLDLEIEKGKKIAIMGPSGSGKTTLLNLLGTLDSPDKGTISINKQMISEITENELLRFRNTQIGFVFQFHHLLPQCSLWENVLLPTLPNKSHKKEFYDHAEELLKFLGIWDQRHNFPAELSGGECQRTAVARALINQPEILLADEPTGSLDRKNAEMLIDMLININKESGITLVIATHSADIAKRMDQVYHIEGGRLKSQ